MHSVFIVFSFLSQVIGQEGQVYCTIKILTGTIISKRIYSLSSRTLNLLTLARLFTYRLIIVMFICMSFVDVSGTELC